MVVKLALTLGIKWEGPLGVSCLVWVALSLAQEPAHEALEIASLMVTAPF